MTAYLQFKDVNLIISSMEALVFHIHSLYPLSSKMNHPNSQWDSSWGRYKRGTKLQNYQVWTSEKGDQVANYQVWTSVL